MSDTGIGAAIASGMVAWCFACKYVVAPWLHGVIWRRAGRAATKRLSERYPDVDWEAVARRNR